MRPRWAGRRVEVKTALPLNTWHLPHHAEPCQSPAVGALPWLPALPPSPPPLPGLEPPPESALGFLLGGWGQTPSCSGKGGLALGLQGPLLPSSGVGTMHSPKRTENARFCVCSSPPGKHDLSPGVKPEAQPSPPRESAGRGGSPGSGTPTQAGGRTREGLGLTRGPRAGPGSER